MKRQRSRHLKHCQQPPMQLVHALVADAKDRVEDHAQRQRPQASAERDRLIEWPSRDLCRNRCAHHVGMSAHTLALKARQDSPPAG
jgi:hypothetical protein